MWSNLFRRQAYYIASAAFVVLGLVYFLACIIQPYVGLELNNVNGQWIVTSSNPHGEAYKSGVRVGDQILKINNQEAEKYGLVLKWGEAEGASTIEVRRQNQPTYTLIKIPKQPILTMTLSESPMTILGFVFWFLGF